MKFCEKCGHQLLDEAVMCVNCGCMVASAAQNISQNTEKSEKPAKDYKEVTLHVSNFLFSIASILCMFFIFASLVYAWTDTTVSVSGYQGLFSAKANTYFDANDGWGFLTFISGVVSVAFAIVSFVMALVKKAGLKELFSSIIRLFMGFCFVIISIMIML